MDRLRYLLGILTLIAMFVGGWFLLSKLESDDVADLYQIKVTFKDARGLKPGADVKYRGIQVGSVRQIDVDESGSQAIVLMTIEESRKHLARSNSRFWIVTPRFHGISSGVSGLETLVRDSFVAFSTPLPFGELLEAGSELPGAEAPLRPQEDVALPSIERGDLVMRVMLPENHGVSVGTRVTFRGMATGEVRSIELAPSGTHVAVELRVRARFRSTVTDESLFWVAKPALNLRFSFSHPVAVNELGSLLSPFIAYYTEPKHGVPVQDGYVVAATLDRPSIHVSEVPPAALKQVAKPQPKGPEGPVAVVRVVYEAVDVDILSPNDKLHREGTGLLYVGAKGQTLVVTARSVCDASYFYTETFGERAKIKDEKFAVQLPGSNALKASRIWVQPDGIDLAVLAVQGLPRKYRATRSDVVKFIERKAVPAQGLALHVAGERGETMPAERFDLGKIDLAAARGGVLLLGTDVIGFVGQISDSDEKPNIVTLLTLPESFRPGE